MVDNELFPGTIKKKYDYRKVFQPIISSQNIWKPTPFDVEKEDFSTIEIEAKIILVKES